MFTTEDEIHRIGEGVLARTLPKPEWTHAAHFAAALWLMRHRPALDLPRAMPGIIRAYNEATGVANTESGGYHETITQASLRAARAELARHGADVPLHRVVNALLASPLGKSSWLLEYWSQDLLMSAAARRAWREPDLKPPPF
jgi:hypothetical protein